MNQPADPSPEDLAGLEQFFGSLQNAAAQSETTSDSSSASLGGTGDEFSRLQELLVKPEILRMRDQVARLEKALPEVLNMRDQVKAIEEEFPKVLTMGDRLSTVEAEIPVIHELQAQIDALQGQFPEILEMREKVDRIEQRFREFGAKLNQNEELVQLILPAISQLLSQKNTELQEILLQELQNNLLPEFQENLLQKLKQNLNVEIAEALQDITGDRQFSICVSGITSEEDTD